MANVLAVEDELASITILRKILERASHKVYTARSNHEAWGILEEQVAIDLIVLDLRLSEENGWELLERIRREIIFENMPVLVYSGVKERNTVIKVLDLGVQNYLVKPYNPSQLYVEVEKAIKADWMSKFFEDPDIVCSRNNQNLEDFVLNLIETNRRLNASYEAIKSNVISNNFDGCLGTCRKLQENINDIGFSLLNSVVLELTLATEEEDKADILQQLSRLSMVGKILNRRIIKLPSNPKFRRQFVFSRTLHESQEEAARAANGSATAKPSGEPAPDAKAAAASADADATSTIPKRPRDSGIQAKSAEEVKMAIARIDQFPVFREIAESFQDATRGEDVAIEDIAAFVEKDAGLSTQILSFANSAYIAPRNQVDDIEMAIQLLGFRRVQAMSMSMRTASQLSKVFQAFDWQSFWMHQVGCAFLTEDIESILGIPHQSNVYLSALMHDIGKALLSHLFPLEFKQAIGYSLKEGIPLLEVEETFFGMTHEEVGFLYAHKHNLPDAYLEAIRYHSRPDQAENYQELVCIVGLSNTLCKHKNIGFSGSSLPDKIFYLHKQRPWQLLNELVSIDCSMESFEKQINKRIVRLKTDLVSLVQMISYY